MNKRLDNFTSLYEDEAVCFIADRYHITSQELLRQFFVQDSVDAGTVKELLAFRLEDNEMEILRGMIGLIRK